MKIPRLAKKTAPRIFSAGQRSAKRTTFQSTLSADLPPFHASLLRAPRRLGTGREDGLVFLKKGRATGKTREDLLIPIEDFENAEHPDQCSPPCKDRTMWTLFTWAINFYDVVSIRCLTFYGESSGALTFAMEFEQGCCCGTEPLHPQSNRAAGG